MNLRLVASFARAVGEEVVRPDPPVAALEALLDGWAARPEEVLACAAVASYGEVGAVRPDWWEDEARKLRRAAADPRWRVREMVAQALQRMLEADWDRTVTRLREWTGDADPLVVRAAAAGVAEPRLLSSPAPPARASDAAAVQAQAIAAYRAADRATPSAQVLRQALGYTLSVAAAATGDLSLLEEIEKSGDPDLVWIARQNRSKARLRRLRSPPR